MGICVDVFKHQNTVILIINCSLPEPFLMFNDFHVEVRECKLVTNFDICNQADFVFVGCG